MRVIPLQHFALCLGMSLILSSAQLPHVATDARVVRIEATRTLQFGTVSRARLPNFFCLQGNSRWLFELHDIESFLLVADGRRCGCCRCRSACTRGDFPTKESVTSG